MNILVLSNLYPRPNDPGYGIFIHRQVQHIKQLGHTLTVIAPVPWSPKILHHNAKWLNYGLVPRKTVWEGVEVYYPRYLRLPGASFRALAGITVYWGIVSLTLELHRKQPFDVTHSHFIFPNGITGCYVGRKLRLPTVCSVRGNDILTEPFENPINTYYGKQVIQKTQQIVTVSQALKRLVEQFAQPIKSVKVVYNGVEVEKFQSKTLFEQTQSKTDILKPYLLFVGQDIRRKGLPDLLGAFVRLIDKVEHNLVIVGPLAAEVQRLAPALTEQLKNRIVITGPQSPDDIPSYMQNCSLLILPSYEEGLPNVVLEAMACGKPVVATRITGTSEAVIDKATGLLISPGQPLQLAQAIEWLIHNPHQAQEMGKRGQERVMAHFTWQQHAAKMAAIYEDVVNQGIAGYGSD
jgi:hypothetical protein